MVDRDVPKLAVRPMQEEDLAMVAGWLRHPHVARWWSGPDAEIESMRRRVRGEADTATRMLIVTEKDRGVGWAQWYLWDDYPEAAAAMGARPGDAGMDYAIGDPAAIGRGLGQAMIATMVKEIRAQAPGAGIVVGPDEANSASRAVLERNGFDLVAVRQVAKAANDDPVAIYRLDVEPVWVATPGDAEVIGRLLDRFNREFDEPTPGPRALARRVAELMDSGDTDVVLGGVEPAGIAVVRFRPSLWTAGLESNLAELYVTEGRRGRGLGRTIMDFVLRHARQRGADWMSIEVDEPDLAARHLYETLGFTNRSGGVGGPLMFVYERDL